MELGVGRAQRPGESRPGTAWRPKGSREPEPRGILRAFAPLRGSGAAGVGCSAAASAGLRLVFVVKLKVQGRLGVVCVGTEVAGPGCSPQPSTKTEQCESCG